jgi:hypothetical protein
MRDGLAIGLLYRAPLMGPPMRLGLLQLGVKIISSVLLGSAVRLLQCSHLRACSRPWIAESVVVLVVGPVAYIAPLST